MATSIFGIGVSGLNAAQSGLLVTGHNITNAATDGFHRQEAVQGTQTPQETGAGFFGKGVAVDTVRRAYSQFLDNARPKGRVPRTMLGDVSRESGLPEDWICDWLLFAERLERKARPQTSERMALELLAGIAGMDADSIATVISRGRRGRSRKATAN